MILGENRTGLQRKPPIITTCNDDGHSIIENIYIRLSNTTMKVNFIGRRGLEEGMTPMEPVSQPYHISYKGM